jgi:hypothetical protein
LLLHSKLQTRMARSGWSANHHSVHEQQLDVDPRLTSSRSENDRTLLVLDFARSNGDQYMQSFALAIISWMLDDHRSSEIRFYWVDFLDSTRNLSSWGRGITRT